MKDKQYYAITSTVFLVIAAAHFTRILLNLGASIGGYEIPLYASGVAVILAGYLATRGFMTLCKNKA